MINYEKLYSAEIVVNTVDEYNSIATILDKLHIDNDSDSPDCANKYSEIHMHVWFENAKECETFEAELEKINK